MTKIVINDKHGGFSLSEEARDLYKERAGINNNDWYYWDLDRDDPILIQIVEEMGDAANGNFAKLKVVTIPDDVEWQIGEYDGLEWVAEKHRTWS
jgi:hypothetical protein